MNVPPPALAFDRHHWESEKECSCLRVPPRRATLSRVRRYSPMRREPAITLLARDDEGLVSSSPTGPYVVIHRMPIAAHTSWRNSKARPALAACAISAAHSLFLPLSVRDCWRLGWAYHEAPPKTPAAAAITHATLLGSPSANAPFRFRFRERANDGVAVGEEELVGCCGARCSGPEGRLE